LRSSRNNGHSVRHTTEYVMMSLQCPYNYCSAGKNPKVFYLTWNVADMEYIRKT